MSKLGPELAMSGPSLAALCRKRQIPTPPLGYWQKKAVGRAPEIPPLPPFELPQAAVCRAGLIGRFVRRIPLRLNNM